MFRQLMPKCIPNNENGAGTIQDALWARVLTEQVNLGKPGGKIKPFQNGRVLSYWKGLVVKRTRQSAS